MISGKEVISVLMVATAFLLTMFNPITPSLSTGSLIGIALLVLFGSLVMISGMIGMESYYLAPIAALGFIDTRAFGLFLFAFIGKIAAFSEDNNMIKPRLRTIAKAAFSGYIAFVLISIVVAFPLIEFKIPDSVSGMAVELLVPAIGCSPSYTGQECIDTLVSETIDSQCNENTMCISLLNDQRAEMEENLFTQLTNQFPGFDRDKTVREVLQSTLNEQVGIMIEPYQHWFKILMSFLIFSVFQFLSGPLSLLSSILSKLLLKVMEKLEIIKKEYIKVEKIKFSA
ncbi:MAG: hypothetical protein GOV01_02350 [Candidatus Altiarchaeota archaeon]|nr:hypothetical protein [Candidatus Altiarchaeota archaeon]